MKTDDIQAKLFIDGEEVMDIQPITAKTTSICTFCLGTTDVKEYVIRAEATEFETKSPICANCIEWLRQEAPQ